VWLESCICLGWLKLPLGAVSTAQRYYILSSYQTDSIWRGTDVQ